MTKFIQLVLSLLILIVGLYFSVRFISWVFSNETRIVVVSPVIIALMSILGNRWLAQKQSIESITHANRVELYSEFTEFLSNIFTNNDEITEEEQTQLVVESLHNFTPRLISYASNSVLEDWSVVRLYAENPFPDSKKKYAKTKDGKEIDVTLLFLFQDLIKAMRKDLGFRKDIKNNAILKCFVNDLP